MEELSNNKLPKATLNTLLSFVPGNEIERSIFEPLDKTVLTLYNNKTKEKFAKGMFYLGGHLKMHPDDEITLDSIVNVRAIDKQREIEYGVPCNGFEYASIQTSRKYLCHMEEIIIAYNQINELRIHNNQIKI
jgi:hypothetical protein